MNEVIVPEISLDQAKAILMEGLNRELYECLNNSLPEDPKLLMSDANELVRLALIARNSGNKSENIQTILFMAQVDQKPDVKQEEIAGTPAEIAPESSVHNGIDLSTLSDGVIEGLIVGLDKYPPSEQVEEDRKAYLAEKERRNEKGSQIQDDSQSTTPQAAPEKAREAAPEGSPAPVEGGNQTVAEDRTEGPTAEQEVDTAVGGADSAQGENAGAFARAQTPETSPEGKQTKAKPVEEDGKRSALEEQLTLPIVKAHAADITKLSSLPIAQIEFMLENPDGPPTEEKDMAVSESEIVASVVPKDEKVVAGIAADVPVEEKVITKADLGLEVDETTGEISADGLDRENLEAQVTGPCLKAYGRGRKEIPSIGINELKFMIDNPDGKVDPSELQAARDIDNLGKKVVDIVREVDAEGTVESLADPIKISEEKDRTIAEAAKESTAKSPPEEEINISEVEDIKRAEEANKSGNTKSADKIFSEIDKQEQQQNRGRKRQMATPDFESPGQNRAMEIISRENMPIPPSYADESAPVLPVDVSIISRDELFSLHAKFHAYEIRMNYVLMEHEDLMNDCIKLREYREAEVAKAVPFMGEDAKRNTNEFRDSQVKGDKEVLELGMREHEARKVVTDLKVLRNGYHLDCERLSRQMSKYEIERADAPR